MKMPLEVTLTNWLSPHGAHSLATTITYLRTKRAATLTNTASATFPSTLSTVPRSKLGSKQRGTPDCAVFSESPQTNQMETTQNHTEALGLKFILKWQITYQESASSERDRERRGASSGSAEPNR